MQKEGVADGGYFNIECSPHDTQAKCSTIQNQLRPYNYDLEAWQLAHPEKMLISHPEYFTNPDSKDQWLEALNNKILEVRQEIITAKENETDKLAKIARLETKIQELELVKSKIDQQTQTEFSTQEKSTQTPLTSQQIEQLEKENQQLKTLLQATETELTNTKQQLIKLEQAKQTQDQTIQELNSQIEELKGNNGQLTQTISQLNLDITNLKDQAAKRNQTIADKDGKISALETDKEKMVKDNQALQTEIKQLQSKITLLESQKTTYQEKFTHSLQFIKDIRKELAGGEEWKPKSS
jgi:chromosome segregation ATPase